MPSRSSSPTRTGATNRSSRSSDCANRRDKIMLRVLLVVVLLFGAVSPAFAEYPERPVTAICGYPAGGLADLVLRAVVEGMKKKFPKGLAVVNRPGAGGSIGASEMAQAKPDGYT